MYVNTKYVDACRRTNPIEYSHTVFYIVNNLSQTFLLLTVWK